MFSSQARATRQAAKQTKSIPFGLVAFEYEEGADGEHDYDYQECEVHNCAGFNFFRVGHHALHGREIRL